MPNSRLRPRVRPAKRQSWLVEGPRTIVRTVICPCEIRWSKACHLMPGALRLGTLRICHGPILDRAALRLADVFSFLQRGRTGSARLWTWPQKGQTHRPTLGGGAPASGAGGIGVMAALP